MSTGQSNDKQSSPDPWEVWEDAWATQAEQILYEIKTLVKDPPPAWLEDRLPGFTTTPSEPEAAEEGLLGTMVGRKLYGLRGQRRSFPDGPLDPRHPAWIQTVTPLALALSRLWRVPGRCKDQLRQYAADSGRPRARAKVDVVSGALLSALSEEAETAEKVRIFRKWKRDVRPLYDLSPREYLRWLVSRTFRLAERYVGEPPPLPVDELHTAAPDPIPEGDDRIDQLYAAARDETDVHLLDAIAEHGTVAEAARAIELKYETAKKRKQRLEKRVG